MGLDWLINCSIRAGKHQRTYLGACQNIRVGQLLLGRLVKGKSLGLGHMRRINGLWWFRPPHRNGFRVRSWFLYMLKRFGNSGLQVQIQAYLREAHFLNIRPLDPHLPSNPCFILKETSNTKPSSVLLETIPFIRTKFLPQFVHSPSQNFSHVNHSVDRSSMNFF